MNARLLTQDHAMGEIIALAGTIAPSRASVLIQAERGSGKGLLATEIHSRSTRSSRPVLAVRCAGVPSNLIEQELFGYEKDSFDGALESTAGKFELAQGGTLVLDEVGELDSRLQAKLLRALQDGEIERMGARRSIKIDIRLITTSSRNLSEAVKRGQFREDLYQRLSVVTLTLPRLQDRPGDVRYLAEQFIRSAAEQYKKPVSGISQEAISMLELHQWPENVRELKQVIDRAVAGSQNMLLQSKDIQITRTNISQTIDMMPEAVHLDSSNKNAWEPGATLNDIERNVILQALSFHHGNRTHTAKALGISIRTLRNKLAEYRKLGIEA
ncbi:MAG: sigma-54-dependent Fis family transcriptional regulator [Proteobacteria bacterium]|nr:MAG: sigma-54-dependent Fis family transcriptional regulator [Pseudomonadota bacterium]